MLMAVMFRYVVGKDGGGVKLEVVKKKKRKKLKKISNKTTPKSKPLFGRKKKETKPIKETQVGEECESSIEADQKRKGREDSSRDSLDA